MPSLTRTLKLGTVGDDVDGWARAAHRYLEDGQLAAYEKQRAIVRRTFGLGKRKLAKRCAAKAGLPQYGVVGPKLDQAMRSAAAYDALANMRIADHIESTTDTALVTARALLWICRRFTGDYDFGGGHGVPLSMLSVHDDLDCSSSTSLALRLAGLYDSAFAQVSGRYETWGAPGRGRYVTVHANDEHVWIEFTLPDGWFRFDTSPHGDGPHGPRVRTVRRGDSWFIHRHPRGL
jgi:hypothetical protein